ncbi:MAG TPA: pitrilysin family protein [Verrucomicrobiae bacterium]|nr:pitrilysin family protein [Verrucomicrobiae bacterium]
MSTEPITRATLTNGMQVIIVQDPLAPVVTTMINYRVGGDETPTGFPGSAHALEHMMFRGSPGLSAGQLADITAALGGDSNADTQQSVTQYFFTVPVEDLPIVLHIEALRMRGILLTPALWGQERGAIEQEVAQDVSNPDYVMYTNLLGRFFAGTPYAHDALGSRPSFERTTAADLQRFYHTWYCPNNAVLVIAGKVDPQRVLEEVHGNFDSIPGQPLPARPQFQFRPVTPETVRLQTDQPYGMVVVAFRFPGSDSADYAAAQVLSDVLSSQRGELYGLVPAGKALAASFEYDSLPKAGLGYAIAEFPAGAETEALLAQVRSAVTSQITNALTADLVEAAKRREVANFELQRNSVSGLAEEWSQAVAVEGRTSPDEDIVAIERVTVEDVMRVARQYLDLGHALAAILTPQPSGKPVASRGFGGKESFTPTETKAVKLPAWAEAAVNRLEVPASTLSPVVTNLANGLHIIVQPESVSDTVSIYGRIQTNPKMEEPRGQEGVGAVLQELLSYGTTELDRLAFQKALDQIGAIESPGTNFSVQVLTEQVEPAVHLLAQNMLSPALPEAAFKILQPQLAAAVAGELQSPGYQARLALRRRLYTKTDPVQRETTPRSIQSLRMQDVRDYYTRAFRPDLTTIVVIGKIPPQQAITLVVQAFGAWANSGPKPDTVFPPAPVNSSGIAEVPDASRVQDRVVLAQTLPMARTNADYYSLELGNHVLGGAFYATRLYRDLRENAGLVYFVGSDLSVGDTRGIYAVQYACDPPNVAKARAIVVSNLRQMQSHAVSARELRQAKVLLLREVPLSESSVERIAGGWLSRSLLGLPLDEPVRAAHRYLKLNATDVRAAFAKWIRPAELVQVSQGPPPQ